MSAIWFRRLSLGGVCMRLRSGVLLVPSRRRGCPGGQSLSFWGLRKKVTKERAPEHVLIHATVAFEGGGLPRGLTRYGLKLRLQCGAPRLGYRVSPGGSVQAHESPDIPWVCGRTDDASRVQTQKWVLGSFSLVTFSLSQQRESDCPPGHPRRRLAHAKNRVSRDTAPRDAP